MSSGFQLSEFQRFEPLIDDSNNISLSDRPRKDKIETQRASETVQLRFHNLSLGELSDELDRRTKETQRLQEEVEDATRMALEKFGSTRGNRSPGPSSHNNDSSEDCPILSTHQQAVSQPLVCSLDTLNEEVVQSNQNFSQKDLLENTVDNCLQQLSELQLNKMHDRLEQDTCNHQSAIMNLQTKLQEAQMEKDGLSDLRLKDSREHVDQMEKMLCMLEELQNIKRSADQKLQETEDEALALKRKVGTLEKAVKEMYHTLSKKQCGHNFITAKDANSQTQQYQADENEDFNNNRDKLQERCFTKRNEVHSGANKQERIEELITSLGHEMAMLTDKLSSSKDSGIGLCGKLELLKKLSERRASFHRWQISELETTLTSHKDKVCCLEQQLIEAQAQLFGTQRDRDHSLQQAKELQAHLQQLKNCCQQQQLELQEEAEALRGQLEVAREQLCKAEEKNICLQALMDQRSLENRKFLKLLQGKDAELLCVRQQENQQHLVRLEEARSQCQTLQAEQDTLRLKLSDREKMIDVLKLQMESSVQTTVQHSHTIDSLQQENNLLINQLNQHKLDIHQLRADLVQRKSDLTVAECERRQLEASVTEQSQRVREETLEKREITKQLELQRMQSLTLTKEHKELQLLHSCKNDEHEGVVLKLQSQLRSAHDELDKIRRTLRVLEGADGHGLQVALNMQKEITARREQVDSLQSKIQHLEDNTEKLQQEKRYQNLETQRQLQELTFIREEKRQLASELKALRSKDQQLRERISELEAILHKMSESFANCQDFIQLREQEYFRLKLQHALDLKELQGQNLCPGLNVPPPDLDSLTLSAHTVPPSSQHPSNTQTESKRQQESSPDKLGFLVREPRGGISEKHRPHTDKSSSFYRRRSAPEGVHRTSFQPRSLKTAELTRKMISKNPVTAKVYTSFPQLLSLGRRSPVYSLLTSNPNS